MIDATDLPRVRDGLIEFASTPFAGSLREFYVEHQDVSPDSALAEVLLTPALGLAEAELYFATAEMCELATAAARSLPQFTLHPDDPPSPSGLLWFATPVEDVDSEDARVPFFCVAVGWTVRLSRLWITTYVDRDTFPWDEGPPTAMPRYIPMGCWPAPIDDTGDPVAYEEDVGRSIFGTLKTVWLLMRQPLANVSDAHLGRAARRRLQRGGRPVPTVRVLALRRPAGAVADGSEVREWHHRWIVRGHWRMAAVGEGRQQRRPVWVSPHVKGPADAPLIGGEKVYRVDADRGAA
jgi:hypothetical protein